MRFLPLLLRNLLRKKARTLLTIGSFMAALLLFGLLAIISRALSQGVDIAGADRLMVRNRVSLIMPLPKSYQMQIARIDGVRAVTHASWFGGVYQDRRNFFAQFAIDTETWRDVYTQYRMPDEQWQAFVADREGCAVGRDLARRFGWQLGDRIPIEGTIFSGTWELNIRAIYEGERPDEPTMDLWLHYDYLDERRTIIKGYVGWYAVRIADPAAAENVAGAIDSRFANSPFETRSETEAAFLSGLARQIGNIRLLILTVGTVVFFTLLLVCGNTMAITVRERRGELAVMRTMGYPQGLLLMLIMAESLLLAGLGGAAGLVLAKLITLGGDPTRGLLPIFYLAPGEMALGLGLALGLGAIAALLPGLAALHGRIVNQLRGV